MTSRAAPERYTGVAMALHWLMALLVVGNLAGGYLVDFIKAGAGPGGKAAGATLVALHISVGLTVLALAFVRLGWRLASPPPPLPPYMTGMERLAARAVHLGFYLLLFILPLSGWAMVSARPLPAPVAWFGMFTLPPLPVPPDLRGWFRESHERLGWAMLALLALHLLGTLKHRVFDRDNALARMLPRRNYGT